MKPFLCLLALLCWLIPGEQLKGQNPRNVVLYDVTSTDCGHCSCLDSVMKLFILPAHPQTVAIALHSPFNSAFRSYQGNALFFNFDAHFAPATVLDGLGQFLVWEDVGDSLASRYTTSPEAPVLVTVTSKSWDTATRQITWSVEMTNLIEEMTGNFRCQLFVTEDNIKELHRIQTGCATPDDPIGLPFRHDYINDHVVRKVEFIPDTTSATPHWGSDLTNPVWASGETISRTWTIGLDTGWVESNCYLDLVIYRDNEDSLYKSEHLQGIREAVTGGLGSPEHETGNLSGGIRLIYPNPASGRVNIHIEAAVQDHYRLEVVDGAGHSCMTLLDQTLHPGIFNIEFDGSVLASGTYFCRLTSRSGSQSKMLVICR